MDRVWGGLSNTSILNELSLGDEFITLCNLLIKPAEKNVNFIYFFAHNIYKLCPKKFSIMNMQACLCVCVCVWVFNILICMAGLTHCKKPRQKEKTANGNGQTTTK